MVDWKGELSEKSGDKARRLDQVSGFPVPNFFVITSDEIAQLFEGEKDPRKVKDVDLNSEKLREVNEAYSEVDMSSEIRNASGKARNLVGGQRDGSRVSVRIGQEGFQKYQLNVGSSELDDAIRNVVSSHLQENDDFPSVIIQKMIESEISGSALKQGNMAIIEAVKGYGTALEEGKTSPDIYKVSDTIEKKIPERQIEASLNPMTGDIREKEVKRNAPLLKDSQLRQLAEKLSKEKYSIKFTYKRGTFYAVDAFKSPDISLMPEMEGIKVSPGEIDGEPERDYERISEPSNPSKPVIAEKGGATSRAAEKAREKELPAIFDFTGEYQNGNDEEVKSTEKVVNPKRTSTATMVLQADRTLPGELEREFGINFNESYIENADQVLENDVSAAIIDFRKIGRSKGMRALEMTDSEFHAVIISDPETEMVNKLVKQGVDAIASEINLEGLESKVERAERKLIVDAARQILESRD